MKTCLGCSKLFEPKHGNNLYHSTDCQYAHKKEKQKENNAIISALKKGFLANYKLFTGLLPEPGNLKISLLSLLKPGFDQNAFYGTHVDKAQNQWHKVNEYYFMIAHEADAPTLQIYKP